MAPPLPWFTRPPPLFEAPTGQPLYRVYEGGHPWGPLDANPASKARFALRDDAHGMFYVSDRPEGALWEALLRYVVPRPGEDVELPTAKLTNQRLATVQLHNPNVGVVRLYPPAVHHLFGDEHHPHSKAIIDFLSSTQHAPTHTEAAAMLAGLRALDPPIEYMPILHWKSKQFPDANVYLAYDPPLNADDWSVVEDVALDSRVGHIMIHDALEREGFRWTQLTAPSDSELPDVDPD